MASKIREVRLAAQRRYYQKHRAKEIHRNVGKQKAYRLRNKSYVFGFLSHHPCVDCGESDPVVLDFDHVRGKKLSNVSDLTKRPASIKALQAEIDKCDVRCANCHRRITALRNREAAISAPS